MRWPGISSSKYDLIWLASKQHLAITPCGVRGQKNEEEEEENEDWKIHWWPNNRQIEMANFFYLFIWTTKFIFFFLISKSKSYLVWLRRPFWAFLYHCKSKHPHTHTHTSKQHQTTESPNKQPIFGHLFIAFYYCGH